MGKRRRKRRIVEKISQKAGLPPGTLVHIGEDKVEKAKVEIYDFFDGYCKKRVASNIDECLKTKENSKFVWINIEGVNDVENVAKIGKHFGINDLVLEDILNTEERPHFKEFNSYCFTLLKMVKYDHSIGEMSEEQLSLIFGSNFVLTFQEGLEGDVFSKLRERIESRNDISLKSDADFFAYSLIDSCVDSYFLVLEEMGLKIEDLEEETLTNPSPKTLEEIHKLKRNLILLRKSLWPVREIFTSIERSNTPLIKQNTLYYFRDIYDHSLQLLDLVETLRDILSSTLDVYMSSLSNKLNQVMKFLTVISTIFIPLTFIVGIYGMNFKYLPELEWKYGYFAVMSLNLIIALSMIYYFKKKKIS